MRSAPQEKSAAGFTLMELVVVLGLMAVILGLSFPRIRLAMEADGERRKLEAFIALLEATGQEAVEKKEERLLALLADHRGLRTPEGGEWLFPRSLGVQALRRAGRDLPETDRITFYPEGYADPVFFWLEGAMGKKTLVLHPLQVRVEVFEGFVTPEGWEHGA